jgi:integrase
MNTNTPATAKRYRALFSLILREAIRNGRASQNPARLVRIRAEANGRIRFLTDAEEKRLRAVVGKLYPHRMPDLTIALGTGMRLSEQFSLTWDQIDFNHIEVFLNSSRAWPLCGIRGLRYPRLELAAEALLFLYPDSRRCEPVSAS